MNKNHILFWITYVLVSAWSLPAYAQNTNQIEEIIVTAQKRVENIQDVPIAITAFTQSTLSDKNISAIQGLSNFSPNVTLDAGSPFSGSTSVLTAYIRGIGQDDFAFNLDPGVGVYLDGVYLARTVGANTNLLDVERIEVLKGPQGTLFGRNSIGGAISIVTRKPSEDFGFRGELITGRYNRLELRGSVDIPIVEDTLLSSITFASSKRDGYVKRIPFPTPDTITTDPLEAFPRSGFSSSKLEGEDDMWTIRGKLSWRASDRFDVTVSADYQDVDQSGMANTLLDTFPLEGVPGELFATAYNLCISAPTAALPTAPGGNIAALCGPRGTIGTSFAEANIDADPNNDRLPFDDRFITGDIDKSFATGPSFSRLTNWGISTIVDFALTDNIMLKSITGYRDMEWASAIDGDASPVVAIEPGFVMNQSQFSQEFQITGQALNNNLDYIFGAYYFTEEGDLHDFVPFGQGLLQIDGFNDFDTTSWALFTHLNYRINDQLSFTFGGRYTEEDKEFEGFQRDPNGFLYKLILGRQLADITEADRLAIGFPDPNDPLRFYPPGRNKKEFTNFSPRIGVEFKPMDNMMLYASFSQGYKTGGWTTRLSVPESTAPDFDEEEADSFEIGMKSELLERRLQINLAAFYTEYDGIQLTQTNGISPTTRNAGTADIYGAEFEFQAALSDALFVTGSIGYLDDEYANKLPGTTAGDALPKTPEWKVNISPRYTFELNSGSRIIINGDYTYTSSLFNNTENTQLLERDSVDMLNVSVKFEEATGKWSVTVGGTNLFDERYITTGQFQPGGGLIYGTFSRPTEWYAKFAMEF